MVAPTITFNRWKVAETAMHQASILFTFAVMAMAGAWYVMQDMRRADAEPTAHQQAAVTLAADGTLAE